VGVQGESVLVCHLGEWLPGTVLWEYRDAGRRRALVRFETAADLVVRELRWAEELRSYGRVVELPLLGLPQRQDDQTHQAPARHHQADGQHDPAG
jgi:hypothetical protein